MSETLFAIPGLMSLQTPASDAAPTNWRLEPHNPSDTTWAGFDFGAVSRLGGAMPQVADGAVLEFFTASDFSTPAAHTLSTAPTADTGSLTMVDPALWWVSAPEQPLPLSEGLWFWRLSVRDVRQFTAVARTGTLTVSVDADSADTAPSVRPAYIMVPGPPGEDGREIQLQASASHIQWRYAGVEPWNDLVALTVITGPPGADSTVPGPPGVAGPPGADSTVPGPPGVAGPNSVTVATTSDGTGNLTLASLTIGGVAVALVTHTHTPESIGALAAAGPSMTGDLTITSNGHTITDRTPGLLGGNYVHTRPEATGYNALTGSATGVPDKLTAGTISGLTTVANGATWSYFSSVQSDAHLSAMGGGTAGIAVLKATTAAAAATAAGVGAGNSPTFGKILIGGSTGYGGSMIEPVGFGGAGLRWASSTMSLHYNSTGAGIGAASPGVTVGPILKFGTSVWNDLDVALSRNAAGVLEINNGTAGAFRDLKLRSILPDRTDTAAGTTGAATINKAAGSVNLASAATSLVVTNSLVTAASRVMVTVNANDTTCKSCAAVSAAGSFTIYPDAAPTAETNVSFLVLS